MLNDLVWPNDLCEPVIITYNRAPQLDQTLAAFAALNDKHMICHVLDNCSTDDTAEIVATWQRQWPGLRYHRNVYNIGGNANILRALELTNSVYAWVIGDDDVWHLEYIQPLIEALIAQKADIIRLGWLVSEKFADTTADANIIMQHESFFFASLSMISATIARRDLMTAHLNWAYQNICYAYPHLVPYMRAFQERPLSVYSLKDAVITHTPSQEPGYFLGDLEWYVTWFQTARFLKEKHHRKMFIAEIVRYMVRPKKGAFLEFFWLLKVALNAKAQGISQGYYLMELLMLGIGWRLRLVALILLYACFPSRLARGLRRLYFYLKKKEWKELQYDRSRL
ncbi:MAG: hypothetical protein CK424_03020 [Legionella sp.]|nr:MAG: hypothetical protein CK424_03020 [Legionella sp.]